MALLGLSPGWTQTLWMWESWCVVVEECWSLGQSSDILLLARVSARREMLMVGGLGWSSGSVGLLLLFALSVLGGRC